MRRGVTERAAMRISRHKSRAAFDRYDIVSKTDLAESTHSSYLEPAQNEVDSEKENARKPS